MKRRQFLLISGTVLIILSLVGAPAAAEGAPDAPVLLLPKDDPQPDLEAVAKARGWTLQEAAAQEHAADVVGSIAVRIAAERPEIFVGSALSSTPGGAPTLYVKGPADAFVRALLETSDIDIVLADGQPYSFDELEARKHRVHRALVDAGFRNVATGVNIAGGGVIPATVAREVGLPTGSRDILAVVPNDLRSSVALTVGDASGFRETTSFGGMRVTSNGTNTYATSGWAVRNLSTGVTGVTTAGHAQNSGLTIVDPAHPTPAHSFVYQAEHRGDWGDIQWHTTNVAEEGLFYANSSTIRPTMYLEAKADISVGEPVCRYGRRTGYNCSFTVFDTSIECTLSGVYNNRLVQMSGKSSDVGDSGGPWFYNYAAFGSQKGWCSNRDTFSVADLYDTAINVAVIIYE